MMSQHSLNSQTNGASLEDCHTNFFALTDWCGIKWRVFTWESVPGEVDPMEDPVLLSYSRCLQADVLCVWRRTWQPGGNDPPCNPYAPQNQQYKYSVKNSPKELWVFWYGDEPDLSSLVSRELTKNDQNQLGSWDWETGLTYECRTILFKALHNLIERCFLTRGFVRLGKWFVEPYEGPEAVSSSRDTHLSFSLSFFVHGESTVCASVDIRKHPPVRTLTKKHILAAQQRTQGIPVILAPYGMKGTLTGVSYRSSEPATQKLLEEWRNFFPIETSSKQSSTSGNGRESSSNESTSSLPSFVEVLCGNFKLRYPSCFVLVTDMDIDFVSPQGGSSKSEGSSSTDEESNISCGIGISSNGSGGGRCSSPPSSSPFTASTHTLLTPEYLQNGGKGLGWSRERGEAVWQDIIKCPPGGGQASPNHEGASEGGGALTQAELAAQWEFSDPANKISCSCSKCKKRREKLITAKISRGSAILGGTKEPLGAAPDPPFHWRASPLPPNHSDPLEEPSSNPGGSNSNVGFGGYKGSGGMATPGSVPSLRMTGDGGPVPSVDSPASVAPSPLPTPHSQPSSVTPHHESTMPMLSPHQPPSNASMADPCTPAAGDSVDTKNISDIGPKSVSSLNQSMSPYPGMEKPNVSGDNISTDLPNRIGSTNNVTTSVYNSTSVGTHSNASISVGLRKPQLPDQQYSNEEEGSGENTVSDSSKLQAWLYHPVKKFRPTESKSDKPFWPPYRRHHVANNFQPKTFIKAEIKTEPDSSDSFSNMKRSGLKRSHDPYDFEDSVQNSNNSINSNFKIKEEKDLELKGPNSVKSEPLSPSKKCTYVTNESLVPKETDLDDMFDSPGDEFAVQTPPGSNKPVNGSDEAVIPSTKMNSTNNKNGSSNIAELTQLAKMYPTPPSLEQNPDHDTAIEEAPIHIKAEPMDEIHHPPFSQEFPSLTKDEQTFAEMPYVYKPSLVSPFIGSDRYKPLTDLPSKQDKELLNLPFDIVYNPSWQQQQQQQFGNQQTVSEKSSNANHHVNHSHHMHSSHQDHQQLHSSPMVNNSHHGSMMSNHPSAISMFHHQGGGPLKVGMSPISPATSTLGDQGPLSQKGPGSVGGPLSNYELQSPASNQSYLNKTLPSVEPPSHPPPSIQVPEANSLMTNLVLQDSSINLFRDHNFDSCTMCVCNNGDKVLGNIKGSDGTVYLPPSHLSNDEEYIGCSCGFSAVVNRKLAFQSGLFYEDEVDLTGLHEDLIVEKKRPSFHTLLDVKPSDNPDKDFSSLDVIPPLLFELVQRQSLVTLCTPSSVLYRAVTVNQNATNRRDRVNIVEYKDGNEVGLLALDQAKVLPASNYSSMSHDWDNYHHNNSSNRRSVMHKWCYLQFDGPACSQDMIRCMKALQPYLQEAIQKKRSTRLWEPVYNVSGPLTWRQFHRMAVRGTEDMAEPLPIPLLLTGHERDWLSVAPQSVRHWEKLLLEPYTQARNIAYVIVSPDNEFTLKHVRSFFKELSSVYELCRLGRHAPIRRVLRDGIMRVSKRAAGKVANEALDDWFTLLGDTQISTKLRWYSQICCHTLAPHLTTLTMDKSLFDAGHTRSEQHRQAPSPMPPPSDGSSSCNSINNNLNSLNDGDNYQPAPPPSTSGSTPAGFGPGSSLVEVDEDDSPPPAIVVYLVDPFTVGQDQPEFHRLITIGLLRCYQAMLDKLPESMQSHVYVQIVSLESILELANEPHDKSKKFDQLKSLAFSVFMQCRRVLTHTSTVRSLTGFGPASTFDSFLKPTKDPVEERALHPYPVFSPAYILAPVKESRGRHKEAEEALGDPREKSSILYCTYCLSEDQKWLIATATDDLGELLETITINIEIPNRTRRKKASSRRHGLKKLMDWILGVMSIGVHPWRLVIGRLGRIGHGELKGWLSLLSRKSLAMASKNLKDMCKQCSYLYPGLTPCILSACLVSLEPDSSFRIMPDMFTPDERFGQNSQNCNLSTPQDGTCTHILVFPTSATAQSASQQHFQEEAVFNFEGPNGDIFGDQDVDDINSGMDVGFDIDSILGMDTAPNNLEVDSMHEGGVSNNPLGSLPGSPTSQGLNSPSYYSGQARSNGIVMVDPNDDSCGSALQQQPLALGYYVSTASTGRLPQWFWSSCPHLETSCPTFLKSALHFNQPAVTQAEEYNMRNSAIKVHSLDSNCTADVLRFVLEGYNGLSWLVLDPSTQDRRSCLPLHMQVLSHLYNLMASLI